MKRILLLALLASLPLNAATWFATTSSANMSAVTWRGTQGASCAGSGTTLTFSARAAGDVFDSNGCTAIAIDVDPGANGIVTLQTDNTNPSASGPFTCSTSTGAATITANITASANSVSVLTISGNAASPKCFVGTNGNTVTVTASSASGSVGITDSHTVGALTHYINVTGGGNANAFGYVFSGATGSITVNGTCTGATAPGCNLNGAGSATVINCAGSDSGAVVGCQSTSTGTITVTGNLIFGKRGGAANGSILYTPGATNCVMLQGAAAWATTPSVCTATDGTHQQLPSDSNIKTLTNVLSGITYGSYTGTAVTSGQNSGSAN